MRAISIRNPWAWLIIRPDITDPALRAAAYLNGQIKDIENRKWSTEVRGTVLIHASKGMTRTEYEQAKNFAFGEVNSNIHVPVPWLLGKGGIIGSVDIIGCVSDHHSPWFFGKYGFVLANAKPLPFRPWRGQLGFFEVPD